MTPHPQLEPILKGELEYGCIFPNGEDWRLRKFDAGMGETEYRIFKNEKFFAQFDNWKDASTVMMMITCTPKNELRFYKNCICDKFADCFDCVKHYEIRKQILSCNHGDCEECEHLAWSFVAARKQEREKVLKALKEDLQTRFISSGNQWSKGRNSGLIECCNIIDEELRQGKDGEQG